MGDRIHIFTPVYFREPTVRKALTQILNTCGSPGYEVTLVLVDNKSNDSLREFLVQLNENHNNVRTMLLDTNEGKGPAITKATKTHPDFDGNLATENTEKKTREQNQKKEEGISAST